VYGKKRKKIENKKNNVYERMKERLKKEEKHRRGVARKI
jgi:hypothetical protein